MDGSTRMPRIRAPNLVSFEIRSRILGFLFQLLTPLLLKRKYHVPSPTTPHRRRPSPWTALGQTRNFISNRAGDRRAVAASDRFEALCREVRLLIDARRTYAGLYTCFSGCPRGLSIRLPCRHFDDGNAQCCQGAHTHHRETTDLYA